MRFRSKRQENYIDEMIEHEISSYVYSMLERGSSREFIEECVLNRFGDESQHVIDCIFEEENDFTS